MFSINNLPLRKFIIFFLFPVDGKRFVGGTSVSVCCRSTLRTFLKFNNPERCKISIPLISTLANSLNGFYYLRPELKAC